MHIYLLTVRYMISYTTAPQIWFSLAMGAKGVRPEMVCMRHMEVITCDSLVLVRKLTVFSEPRRA